MKKKTNKKENKQIVEIHIYVHQVQTNPATPQTNPNGTWNPHNPLTNPQVYC